MLSPAEIAAYDMQTISTPCVQDIPVFNLLSVLDGKIINEAGYSVDRISGEVTIALPQSNPNLPLLPGPESIVIVGEQPDVARRAIEQNVNCLIVCQAGLPEELRELPTKTCIIATPFDAFRTARMVYHAIEISRICRTDDLEAFHLSDFVDDVKEVVLKSRHRSYPILDENDKVVGTLSRFHLIKPRRKRVVLVDHNEAAAVRARPRSRRRFWKSSTTTASRTSRPAGPIYLPERAGRLDGDDHRLDVSGARADAVAEAGGADGGGHRGRHGHVQIPDRPRRATTAWPSAWPASRTSRSTRWARRSSPRRIGRGQERRVAAVLRFQGFPHCWARSRRRPDHLRRFAADDAAPRTSSSR